VGLVREITSIWRASRVDFRETQSSWRETIADTHETQVFLRERVINKNMYRKNVQLMKKAD
jgi:hypothetical protein